MLLKVVFLLCQTIHGLIHFLGFAKEWKRKEVPGISGKTTLTLPDRYRKILGLIWLLVVVMFITSSVLLLFGSVYWWRISLITVIISQLLIILYWKDAKHGTLLNILILAAAWVGYGDWKLDKQVKEKAEEIFARNPAKPGMIMKIEEYHRLPACVERWLVKSNVTGKEMIRTVRLKQKGFMRTKADGRWMPFESEQYFSVQRPAFVWKAKVNMGGGVFMTARDMYDKGQGNMWIQLMSAYTVAKSTGKEIDQGTMVRYLAEGCWFPSMMISNYIGWTLIDSLSARAIMSYRNNTASGVFTFTPEGDVKSFDALRYGEFDGRYSQERWHVENKEYKEFEGIRIPSRSEITWRLKKGDFTWLKVENTEVEYNIPEVYSGN